MLCYDKLKNKPNVLLAFTSLTQPEFEGLLDAFEPAWNQYILKEFIADRKRQYGGGRKPVSFKNPYYAKPSIAT